jgi:5-bromo-4-chloroindolyl phosphate hydrolysis protein
MLANTKRYLSFRDSSTLKIRSKIRRLKKITIPKRKLKKVKKPPRINQATKRVRKCTKSTYS